ncbi:MAG: septal ring lytic transglycosylase RlpA family protein [Thermoanaerobaculia bacterium]|nr:septal ring lytic transglycosylase RlpA family protein [Thermoanaerobaculia bacterium]
MRRPGAALVLAFASLWLAACATTRPAPPVPGDTVELRGLASWYGDEFAGRPTANGEIFDPKQLTAAHRTLPFGTVVEITYTKTGRTTRVRVNDRGPFVGNRIIDLSYAAAVEIGMMEDGIGEVEMAILSVGAGEREPPKPYNVTIPPATAAEPAVSDAAPSVAPAAPPPPPAQPRAEPAVPSYGEPVIITEEIDTPAAEPSVAPPPPTVRPPAAAPPPPVARPSQEVRPAVAVQSGWAVQLGAFSVEANAIELKAKAERVTRPVSIDRVGNLHRVRVGPWAARSRAIEEKERLEDAGFQAIVVSVN